MRIVPSGDELIIEAHVTQVDRKAVHSGLQAKIHLSAYSSRVVPKIPGTVPTVSADRLIDDTTHQPHYLARVGVDRQRTLRQPSILFRARLWKFSSSLRGARCSTTSPNLFVMRFGVVFARSEK